MWLGRNRFRCPRKLQAPSRSERDQRSTKQQTPNTTSRSPSAPLELGIWSFSGPALSGMELGASLVGQRQRNNSAVEKIVHLTGARAGITENRIRVRAINVFVALAWDQETGAGSEDDVVRQQRPILNPEAAIEADLIAGAVGEEDLADRFRFRHPDVVHVQECFQFRRDIGVVPVSENDRARIDEVRLPFAFARAQIDHETVALLKVHRRAAEIESLMHEKAERPAEEERLVEDRVEPGGV